MERNKNFKVTIGSFDFIKGLSMIAVIYCHSIEVFKDYLPEFIRNIIYIPFALSPALMIMFFISIGYRIQKTDLGKSLKKNFKDNFIPIFWIIIASVFLHYILSKILFWKDNVAGLNIEHVRFASGMVLGYPQTVFKGDEIFYNCGPVWFLFALVIAGILFSILLNSIPEKLLGICSFLCAAAGWALSLFLTLPWCIPQGLVACFFLYVGYKARTSSFIKKSPSKWFWTAFAACTLALCAGVIIFKANNNIAYNIWNAGPASILVSSVCGLGFTWLLVRAGNPNNFLHKFIEKIGYNSIFVFAVHSVELQAIPWNHVYIKFFDTPLLGMLIMFIFNVSATAAFYFILKLIRLIISKIKNA